MFRVMFFTGAAVLITAFGMAQAAEARGGCSCGGGATYSQATHVAPAPAAVSAAPTARRSYSYEPTYVAPRRSSGRRLPGSNQFLDKADPAKYMP